MFAVGPNPWLHYKYADKYRPYNLEEAHYFDTASSSRTIDHNTEKTKSSAHPILKEVKTEAKHVKSSKHTTWVKTKEVAEHVKDGIAKSVELTLESVAFCVKPAGDDSTDVVGDGKITTIKENDDPDNIESDVHGVFDANTKTWDDIKAKVDLTVKQSKEYPGVDLDANKACHSGFAGHRDDKRKKSINTDEKVRSIKEIYDPENIESDVHGVFDADTKTWDDIKAKVDLTLKQSKEYPGVDLDANKACHSGFAGHRDDKRKKSINADEKARSIKEIYYPDNIESDVHGVFDADTKTWDDIKAKVDLTIKQSKEYIGVDSDAKKACHSGFAGHRDDKRKKSINADEKARVDRELKNIAHCILGSFDDADDNKWDDIKTRTDAILENSKKIPAANKGFDNSTDLIENAIQQEKDPTISLTKKEIDSVNRDLAAIWKVEEKFEITEDDIVGSSPDKVNFVIKGGFKIIHATMPDVFEVRREAIAATPWNHTVNLFDDDIPLDEDVFLIAQQNRDLDAIVDDLRYI